MFIRSRILPMVSALLVGAAGLACQSPEPLTLRAAIDTALKRNPAIAVASADVDAATAAGKQARAALLPQLTASEDISRGNDPVFVFGSLLRQNRFTQSNFALDALNRPPSLGNFSTRISGSWTAFDSLKTQKNIHRSEILKASAVSSSDAASQRIVLDVVKAYQGVLYGQRQIELAQHEQETAQALLDSVEDHVKAGLAVNSEELSARVNVAGRAEELIVAQGEEDLAQTDLQAAMGFTALNSLALKPIEAQTLPPLALADALTLALKHRPDLIAIGLAGSAQSSAISAARSDFGPRVNVYGNWEDDRASLAKSGGNNWTAGVQISMDILPIEKRARVESDRASKAKVDAQLAALQQTIRREVSLAFIQRRTADLALTTALASIDESVESLRVVRNRYAAGLASLTELLRAEDAERQSQSAYWGAVYRSKLAYVDLLFATGTLTPDAAEGLQ